MRIGFDAKRAFTNKSGLGNYSRDIIRSLSNYYPENEYYLFSPTSKTNLIDKKYLNNLVCPKGIKKTFSSYWRSMYLGKEIKRNNIDIFHGLSNELPYNIKISNAKKIVTIHDLIFKSHPELYNKADIYIYDKKFKFACKESDIIVAISNQTKKDIIKYYNIDESKIKVIYQSCNSLFFEKADDSELKNIKTKYALSDEFLLTVGTIEKRKNVLSVLKAIKKYNIKTKYVIVGKKTDYYKEVLEYASNNNMKNQLLFLENLDTVDLRALYQLSSVFIYPSIYEGFGIPVLEAQNSGVPVITSKFGSTKEAAGDGALLINPLDCDEIGKAIETLLQNIQLRQDLVEKYKMNILNFKQEKISKELISLYNSVL